MVVPAPTKAKAAMLGSGPILALASMAARGSMPVAAVAVWPCSFWAMVMKAPKGSATRMRVLPEHARSCWMTAAEAWLGELGRQSKAAPY